MFIHRHRFAHAINQISISIYYHQPTIPVTFVTDRTMFVDVNPLLRYFQYSNDEAEIVPSSSDEELDISINSDDEETEEQIIERRRKERQLLVKVSKGFNKFLTTIFDTLMQGKAFSISSFDPLW